MLDQHRLATFRVFGLFLQRILQIGPGLSISLRIGELLGFAEAGYLPGPDTLSVVQPVLSKH